MLDCSFDLAADPEAGARAYAAGAHSPAPTTCTLRTLWSARPTPLAASSAVTPAQPRDFAARFNHCFAPASRWWPGDRSGGMYGARLCGSLRWLGHAEVAVLDGAPARPLDDRAAAPADARRRQTAAPSARYRSMPTRWCLARLRPHRSMPAGETLPGEVEALDNKPATSPAPATASSGTTSALTRRFCPPLLRAEFETLLAPFSGDDVIHQCSSGVTACTNQLAMVHAGLAPGRPLPGLLERKGRRPQPPHRPRLNLKPGGARGTAQTEAFLQEVFTMPSALTSPTVR